MNENIMKSDKVSKRNIIRYVDDKRISNLKKIYSNMDRR